MQLTDTDFLDLLNTTRPNIKVGFTDISQELRDYIIVPYLLTTKGGLKVQRGGLGIEETLMVNHGGRSRFIGELEEDTALIIDHLRKMKLYFTLLNDSIAYSKVELQRNRGKNRENNVMLPKTRSMWLRVAETMEEVFFETPSADDELRPWGLKYWIVKNATAGFNGGYPAGFTRIANINLTEVPQFKNYTDQYTAVTKADLITKMRRAHRRTKWRSPKPQAGFDGDAMLNKRVILTNEDTLELFENIGEGQNENLGRDLAPYTAGYGGWGLKRDGNGNILFKGNQIVYAEPLDADTSDPIYGLDMNTIYAMTEEGDNMNLGEFKVAPTQHRAFAAQLDHAHQVICSNRRNNWVISK